jgi:lipopolysaccharide transport system ATP-binding protein
MNDIAVRVQGIGKQYVLGGVPSGYQTLRDTLADGASKLWRREDRQPRRQTIWALRDINFDVREGQVLGIIGKNGAGKSTLLKILSRVTEPTEGEAEIHGRVGSLLEVGTGFHPELTGRENIYLNGAILGMKHSEIESKFDEIVAFSEVEEFIDTPIKYYSTGMGLRLAFSVAAHFEPEILVVDEVLAVGDAEFQRKCLGKMDDVSKEGRTILFVSHDMSAILRLTDEVLVLDQGRIVLRASPEEAVDTYMTRGMAGSGERTWSLDNPAVAAAHPFRPIRLRLLDQARRPVDRVKAVEDFTFEFEYELVEGIQGLRIGYYLFTSRGESIFTTFDTDNAQTYQKLGIRSAGRYISRCHIPGLYLNEGRFVIGVNASAFRVRSYFTDEHAMTFTVDPTGAPGSHWAERRKGPLRPALEWEIAGGDS